jgi:hypothetical protein
MKAAGLARTALGATSYQRTSAGYFGTQAQFLSRPKFTLCLAELRTVVADTAAVPLRFDYASEQLRVAEVNL